MISFNTTDDSRDLGQFTTSKDRTRYGRTTRTSSDDATRRAEQELGLLVSHLPGAPPSPPGEDSRSNRLANGVTCQLPRACGSCCMENQLVDTNQVSKAPLRPRYCPYDTAIDENLYVI